MFKFIVRSLVLLLAATLTVLMATDNSFNRTVEANNLAADPNPLLAEWAGPYGGLPPFDKVQIALFKPALESAMSENLSEVENIAKGAIGADLRKHDRGMEKAGHTLDRVTTIYGIWGSTMASPEFQVVQREMAPKLAAFNDQITQNEPLFQTHRGCLQLAGQEETHSRAAASGLALLHELCAVRRKARCKGQSSGLAKSTSNSPGYSLNSVKTFCLKKTTSSSR